MQASLKYKKDNAMITFEKMPETLEQLQATINNLCLEVKQLRAQQPINEPPIDSKELMKRLQISEPTLIAMRKRNDIPFINVRGNYRYVWQDVISSLQQKKK